MQLFDHLIHDVLLKFSRFPNQKQSQLSQKITLQTFIVTQANKANKIVHFS